MFKGDAFTWFMSWVAIVGVYRKRRLNSKQVSPQLDVDKSLQESRLTLTDETNNQEKCLDVPRMSPDVPTSSTSPAVELQIEMLKKSLEGKLEAIMQGQKAEKRVQELQHREIRRRLEQVEKKPHSGFFN